MRRKLMCGQSEAGAGKEGRACQATETPWGPETSTVKPHRFIPE